MINENKKLLLDKETLIYKLIKDFKNEDFIKLFYLLKRVNRKVTEYDLYDVIIDCLVATEYPVTDKYYYCFYSYITNKINNLGMLNDSIDLEWLNRKEGLEDDSITHEDFACSFNRIKLGKCDADIKIIDQRTQVNQKEIQSKCTQKSYVLVSLNKEEQKVFETRDELFVFLGAKVNVSESIKKNRTIHKKWKLYYNK